MPPGNGHYTLVGFSAELDWRPVRFVKPIPPNRGCGACRLVRKRTALLPCSHTLCESSYKLSAQGGPRVCPLDGKHYEEDDVDWRDFATEELLKRKVTCWNEEHGCEAVMAASEICRHFQQECGHYCVYCPKCSAGVLCDDIYSHLRSECNARHAPLGWEYEVQSSAQNTTKSSGSLQFAAKAHIAENRERPLQKTFDNSKHQECRTDASDGMNAFKETLQEFPIEMRKKFNILSNRPPREISMSNEVKICLTTQSDAINILSNAVENLEKTFREELVKVVSETRDQTLQVQSSVAAVEAAVKNNNQMVVEKVKKDLRRVPLHVTSCNFIVKGVQSLYDTAVKNSRAIIDSEKVYLHGYCMSPGLSLRKNGESVELRARLRLHEGDMDDFLQWPFGRKIRLSVMHPKDGSKRELEVRQNCSQKYCQRPTQSCIPPACYTDVSLDLDHLITDGYVENDEILINWKLLS